MDMEREDSDARAMLCPAGGAAGVASEGPFLLCRPSRDTPPHHHHVDAAQHETRGRQGDSDGEGGGATRAGIGPAEPRARRNDSDSER